MKFTKMHGCGNDYVYVSTFDEEVRKEISAPEFDKEEFVIRVSDRHKGIGSDGVIFINPCTQKTETAVQESDSNKQESDSAAQDCCGSDDAGSTDGNADGHLPDCEIEMHNADGNADGHLPDCEIEMHNADENADGHLPDCEMEMYNADGTRSEMCGNGIRCVAKYVFDHAIVDKTEFVVESMGIPHKVQIETTPDGKEAQSVRVDMGEPILKPERIPVQIADNSECCINHDIYVMDANYSMTCMSFGNPHAVIFMDNIDNMPIDTFGPAMENHPCFPNRVNAEFVKVLDRNNIRMRVWERGTGETFACGTGACAAALASMLNEHTDYTVTVHLLGGDLEITWDRASNHVYMTGEAVTVFEGEVM